MGIIIPEYEFWFNCTSKQLDISLEDFISESLSRDKTHLKERHLQPVNNSAFTRHYSGFRLKEIDCSGIILLLSQTMKFGLKSEDTMRRVILLWFLYISPQLYCIWYYGSCGTGNGGKEVKLFTNALKAFQCNNRIVMAQRKHLDHCLRGRIIGRLECGRTQLEVSEELGIAQSVISRI
ncbi:transposable element Tcb1 transposase [Trichonephila clavipes]|nr:transposable element Tcb1 transposase [Trichonephila clavipes]